MNLRSREFTAPNGIKRNFWFRDGTNDESTIIACFEQDYYGILKEDFKTGDVVIDLGAHIGAVTCLLATIPGLKIIAVEALPENCEILHKNLAEGGAGGTEVVTYENAIWSRSNEKVSVCYGDNSEGGKVHRFVGTIGTPNKQDSFIAKTISLSGIFKKEKIKTCRFLKVDIEGAEDRVISKAPQSVLNNISVIRGEYHSGDYHKLLRKVKGFEDITPDDMNPIKESLTEFLWRRKDV